MTSQYGFPLEDSLVGGLAYWNAGPLSPKLEPTILDESR